MSLRNRWLEATEGHLAPADRAARDEAVDALCAQLEALGGEADLGDGFPAAALACPFELVVEARLLAAIDAAAKRGFAISHRIAWCGDAAGMQEALVITTDPPHRNYVRLKVGSVRRAAVIAQVRDLTTRDLIKSKPRPDQVLAWLKVRTGLSPERLAERYRPDA